MVNYPLMICLEQIAHLVDITYAKGQVLMDYIKDKNYQKVSYFGDGFNDFCPATKLRKNDHMFPRKEFACDLKIQENQNAVQAKVQSWENGIDLLVHLKNKV